MTTISERTFHLLMGGLFLGSCFLDEGMRTAFPSWSPPEANLITMVIGMIWVARYAAWKQTTTAEKIWVIEDRVQRLEKVVGAVEDQLREHLRGTDWVRDPGSH